MKLKLIAVLLVLLLGIAGCSGNKTKTPEDKIATINTMMNKGYEMTEGQSQEIKKAVEDAKKLLSENKTEEANKLLIKTITAMELIAETDRFNKSE